MAVVRPLSFFVEEENWSFFHVDADNNIYVATAGKKKGAYNQLWTLHPKLAEVGTAAEAAVWLTTIAIQKLPVLQEFRISYSRQSIYQLLMPRKNLRNIPRQSNRPFIRPRGDKEWPEPTRQYNPIITVQLTLNIN